MRRGLDSGSRIRAAARACQWAGVLVLVAVSMGCPSGGGGGVSNPALSVLPSAFNFGPSATTDNFAITNAGEGVLIWAITGLPSWLDVDQANGSTPVGGPTVVQMTVDRTGLAPGTYQGSFSIQSNGGTRIITVTLQVTSAPLPPTLQVTPASLDFGNTTISLNLSVANIGAGTVNWQLTETIPWLSTSLVSGSTGATPTTVIVTVNRNGLAAGLYDDDEIEFTSDGGDVTVPITMVVPGPVPELNVTPTVLNFGTSTIELSLNIRNIGTGTLNWNLAEAIPWLTLSTVSGSTLNETDVVTVTVDRSGLAADDYTGIIAVNSNGGDFDVTANMTVAPAQLIVTPTTLNFGKFATNKLFTVRNGGAGTVNWTIDEGAFPVWLDLNPNAGDVTTETDPVVVSVDRTGLAPGNYTHTFTVDSDAGSVNVTVNMTVSEVPVLTVETGFVNSSGRPLAPVGAVEDTFAFTIRNTGTGTLNWNIDPDDFPDWLAIVPVAGTNTGAQISNLTIAVTRLNLAPGGYSAQIPITSNGGNTVIEVTMQVPLRPVIGVIPDNLDFGLAGNSSSVFVANIGDPGTVLNFLIVSDRNWLFVSPATGTSIGTSSPIKDYQTINVSIDRSLLESTGATGTLTVYALDPEGNIDPDILPETITVSVEAAPLSFQTSIVRARIPSMLRFSMLLRDIRNQSFFMAPELLTDAFRIFEDGILIEEPSETTQVVLLQNSVLTAPISDFRTNLRVNAILTLDYSGSMRDAAIAAGAASIQDLHEQAGGQFIDDFFTLFANVERGFAKIAIMEFHDRNMAPRVVIGFTDDQAALQAALQGIVVTDNGATELLPAVEAASDALEAEDFPLLPFDDADVRAIVLLSDGRLTTPPGQIQDTIDVLVRAKSRVFGIGFGEGVNHEPLARLGAGTGGHYYLVQPDVNNVPNIPNFLDKIEECNTDLATHTVLSYVTLGEGENVPLRFDGALNDPNDNPDQGLIQGTLEEQNVDLLAITGDVSLGQISMRTTGIVGGATELTLRLEYAPRNIDEIQFTLTDTSTNGFAIALVPLDEGGIVDNWTLTPLGGGVFSLTAPVGIVLPYGAFGDLVRLTYGGPEAGFTTTLFVNNAIYAGDPEPKYFIYPDTIDVGPDPFLAPAHPTPFVFPTFIDFGTALNSANVTVRNIGGTYPYAPDVPTALLNWEIEDFPFFVNSINPSFGSRATTIGTDTMVVGVNRTINPGVYNGTLLIAYNAGTINTLGFYPVLLRIQVTPAVLSVNGTANLDFGNQVSGATPSANFTINNSGQSTLSWVIDTATLASWVTSISPTVGQTTTETETITVDIDTTGLSLGPHSTSFNIFSNGGNSLNVTISVTVI